MNYVNNNMQKTYTLCQVLFVCGIEINSHVCDFSAVI